MKINTKERKRETPPTFNGRFSEDGGLNFGEYTRRHLKLFIKENPGMPFELKPLLPESENQRGFFEGAIIPLWVYLDGADYKNYKVREQYREYSKLEFNPEIVTIHNKIIKLAGSTKNKLNQGFIERVVGFLEDNYGIDSTKALDPKLYKKYKEEIYPNDVNMRYDTFIDFMVDLKII